MCGARGGDRARRPTAARVERRPVIESVVVVGVRHGTEGFCNCDRPRRRRRRRREHPSIVAVDDDSPTRLQLYDTDTRLSDRSLIVLEGSSGMMGEAKAMTWEGGGGGGTCSR